jgi:hypothetical protein
VSRRPASPDTAAGDAKGREPATVVIVVARGEQSLHRYTLATFESEPAVDVILDRRHGERRHHAVLPAVERRQGDRRATQRVDLLKAHGWLIIRGAATTDSH